MTDAIGRFYFYLIVGADRPQNKYMLSPAGKLTGKSEEQLTHGGARALMWRTTDCCTAATLCIFGPRFATDDR